MPIAYLFPDGVTDTDSNIDSGVLTDIDEGVDGGTPDAALMTSVANDWAGGAAITFTLTDLPGEATGINSVTLRVRAEVGGGLDNDTIDYVWDMAAGAGFNANTVAWDETDEAAGLADRTASVNSGASVAQVNAASVRVRQLNWSQTKGPDNLFHAWDGFELEVDYAAADPNTAELPSATLTLTPNAPQAITTENNIAAIAAAAVLTLTANVPTVETFDPNTVTLPSATLTLAPQAPQAITSDNQVAQLSSAVLTLAPNVPQSITTEKHIAQLPAAVLTLTPNVPQAVTTEKHIAELPSATLTLTENVPQTVTSNHQVAQLPVAALTLTPNVPQAATTEKHIAQLPSVALTLTPNVPQAVTTEGDVAELPSAALTLTENVPQAVVTENNVATLLSATLTLTPNAPQAVTTEGVAYEQEGFRFRNDDGTEITATWRQTQDVDDTVNKSTTIRVRVLTDTSGDAPSITRTLQVKRDDEADTEYRDV